jgi:hypothetical protein
MTRVGFEPMFPVFEPAKTFHALDRTSTVTGTECPLSEMKQPELETAHSSPSDSEVTNACI